jgi:hypothetical protein
MVGWMEGDGWRGDNAQRVVASTANCVLISLRHTQPSPSPAMQAAVPATRSTDLVVHRRCAVPRPRSAHGPAARPAPPLTITRPAQHRARRPTPPPPHALPPALASLAAAAAQPAPGLVTGVAVNSAVFALGIRVLLRGEFLWCSFFGRQQS